MTFEEARLSLQVLAEERVGAPMRQAARERREREDATWAAAIPKVN